MVAGRQARCSGASRRHHMRRWRADASAEGGRGCRETPLAKGSQMLLTIKEVSSWLNIKRSTLYLWVAQGKIPYQRIHSLIRFEKHMIEKWLASFYRLSGPPLQIRRLAADADLDALIEAAKREAYTSRHGETITPSPTGKE
mgnify:CR=1 FL=1